MSERSSQVVGDSRESASPALPVGTPASPTGSSVLQFGPSALPPVSPHEKTVIRAVPEVYSADSHQGGKVAELAKVLIGKQLDEFALDELIGSGGMGAVFRGRDLSLGRQVAVKVVPQLGNDADSLRRFRVEAQSAAKLDHPNIARVHYVGASQDWNYIVFEYIEGVNLRDWVLQHGPLSLDDSVYFLRQIAEALEHASSRDVIHRDIKPSNILLMNDGRVKLVDMGLARTTEEDKSTDLTASGVTLGTFDYLSPEQASDPRQVDVRSDLYSLGCTWYYLLTGKPPFPDGTMIQKLLRHRTEAPPDPRQVRPDLSRDVVSILNKLIAKRPIDRYQRPLDLIHDLQVLAEVEKLPRSRTQPVLMAPESTLSESRRMSFPWMAVLVVVLIAAVASQYWESRRSDIELPGPVLSNGPRPGSEPKLSGEEVRSNGAGGESKKNAPEVSGEVGEGKNLDVVRRSETEPSMAANGGSPPLDRETEVLKESVFRSEERDNRRESLATSEAKIPATWIVVGSRLPEEFQGLGEAVIGLHSRVATLEEAFAIAAKEPSLQEIVITQTHLDVGSLKVPRGGLTVRGADGVNVHLRTRPTAASQTGLEERLESIDTPRAWFDVGRHSIHFQGLELKGVLDRMLGPWSVFECEGSAHLRLTDCMVTVENLSQTADAALVRGLLTEESQAGERVDERGVLVDPLQIELDGCIVRGQLSGLVLPEAVRTEFAWRNGLFAGSAHLLDAYGSSRPTKVATNLRLELNRVTIACGSAMLRLQFDRLHPYRVMVARNASNCVFWQAPTASMMEIRGVEQWKSLSDYLDMRGEDNAYDDGMTQLATVFYRDGRTLKCPFSEYWDEVVREHSPEAMVRWVHPIPPDLPYHLHRPMDYRQRPGTFRPGFIERELREMTQ